jgi:hypothetical protein
VIGVQLVLARKKDYLKLLISNVNYVDLDPQEPVSNFFPEITKGR